jgi:CarD family transcriptional regulator
VVAKAKPGKSAAMQAKAKAPAKPAPRKPVAAKPAKGPAKTPAKAKLSPPRAVRPVAKPSKALAKAKPGAKASAKLPVAKAKPVLKPAAAVKVKAAPAKPIPATKTAAPPRPVAIAKAASVAKIVAAPSHKPEPAAAKAPPVTTPKAETIKPTAPKPLPVAPISEAARPAAPPIPVVKPAAPAPAPRIESAAPAAKLAEAPPGPPRPAMRPMGRPGMPPSFSVRGPGRPPGFAESQITAPRPPTTKVDLKAGDHVVYPTHGVGTVQGIETTEAAGLSLQAVVVTFEENRMTLRVPLGKVASAGLRKLFTPKEFEQAIETLKGRARIKRTMWSRRAQEYEAKINSGDPIQIAEVVRDLQRNAGQPDQSFSERQIYEQALERLAAEYAAIEKIDRAAAAEKLVEFAKMN